MSTDPTAARPPRYGYQISVSWPDGRTFISESSSNPSLAGIAATLRSIAEDVDRRAAELDAEDRLL